MLFYPKAPAIATVFWQGFAGLCRKTLVGAGDSARPHKSGAAAFVIASEARQSVFPPCIFLPFML